MTLVGYVAWAFIAVFGLYWIYFLAGWRVRLRLRRKRRARGGYIEL